MTLKLRVTVISDSGLTRKINEDAANVGGWTAPSGAYAPSTLELSLSEPQACLVADGLGGHACGDIASSETIRLLAKDPRDLLDTAGLTAAIARVHLSLQGMMLNDLALDGMGTTLVGLIAHQDRAVVVNIGDSRAFRVEGGYLGQLSVDDNPSDPALSHVVTQTIGGGAKVRPPVPHISEVTLEPGQRYLLCTDGLTDFAALQTLENCLSSSQDDRVVAHAMLTAALDGGGGDNVTLVLVSVLGACGDLEGMS